MHFTVKLIYFVAFGSLTFGAIGPVYNASSGPEDYTNLVGRQMQYDIDSAELEITIVKARHAKRLESITSRQQLILQEVQQFDNNLVMQQALNLDRKTCVQRYKSRLPTLQQVDGNLTLCLSKAEDSALGLTDSAERSLQNAEHIRTDEVSGVLNLCKQIYGNTSFLNVCVITHIDEQVNTFNQQMDVLHINLRESLSKSSVISAEIGRCSFAVEKEVFSANGAMANLAAVCVEDLKNDFLIENDSFLRDSNT